MGHELTIVVIVIILIIVEFVVFRHLYRTEEDREDHENQLWVAIAITVAVGFVLCAWRCGEEKHEQEYGLFTRKNKKTVPPVASPTANRKIYGNPMKAPAYKISDKYQEPPDASHIYGGASAAANINRRRLSK